MSERKEQEPQQRITPEQQVFFDKKMEIVKKHFGDREECGLFSDVINDWAVLSAYESGDFIDPEVIQELVLQKEYAEAVAGRFMPDRKAWERMNISQDVIDDQVKTMVDVIMAKSSADLVKRYNDLVHEFNAELDAIKQKIVKGGASREKAVRELKEYATRATEIILSNKD